MKVQFKALRAFTFFLGVVFGRNNAFTNAQYLDFQDQAFPMFGKVPYRIRCNFGHHSTLDSAVTYPTRCTIVPYGSGSPHLVNPLASVFAIQNPDAVNTPYSAELSQLPDTPQIPSVTFFTREPVPPYLTGKPAEDQKVQTTFSFRQADVNQEAPHPPHSLFNDFLPFLRTKQSRRLNDESEHSSSANRNQHFISKILPSEAINSIHPFRRFKLMHPILTNKDPIHSLGDSLYKQRNKPRRNFPRENELTKSQLQSSTGNRPQHSFTSPSSETPESSPSSASFSEEQEDSSAPQDTSSPSLSEEQEDPFFPQDPSSPYSSEEQQESFPPQDFSSPYFSEEEDSDERKDAWWPYFSEEQEVPFYLEYTAPPSFSEEQKPYFRRHFLPPPFPQEQEHPSLTYSPPELGASSFPRYTPYAESPALTFLVSDDAPFTKPLPSSQEHDSLADVMELLKLQKINERPRWYNDEANYKRFGWGIKRKDNEDVWSPIIRRRPDTILSKIQRTLKRVFRFPAGVQTRND